MPAPAVLSLRDPVHGFVRADALEAALIDSAPLQRLRFIHQLGLSHLVFPGAEHSRFSHAVGAMELAGRVYDQIAAKSDGLLPGDSRALERRLVRAAALLHDVGHAPFSHSAEELFEGDIDHEEMTRRLLGSAEIRRAFERHGDGLEPERVQRLLAGRLDEEHGLPHQRLLAEIISGELDVDKMDYLLRDSLYCGVRYGNFDLERLLDTITPIADPTDGSWGIGVEEGGVHALEALVMARYYMFTQVYFNVVSKALELHLYEWLRGETYRWPADPERFLAEDDLTTMTRMRASASVHARAVVHRRHFPLAYQSGEHLTAEARDALLQALREVGAELPARSLLISHSAKEPHRLGRSRVLVRRLDGSLAPMEEASHFIRHLRRIEQVRVYSPADICAEVAAAIRARLGD